MHAATSRIRLIRQPLCWLCLCVALGFVTLGFTTPSLSQDKDYPDMDALKTDFLAIGRDIYRLERDWTQMQPDQLTVVLSVNQDFPVAVDSVVVYLDDQLLNETFDEKAAKQFAEGGVKQLLSQRLTPGRHQVYIYVAGIDSQGQPYRVQEHSIFDTDGQPRWIEASVNNKDGAPRIELRTWRE